MRAFFNPRVSVFAVTLLFTATVLTAQVWTQVGADIDGESVGDLSGVAVAISADGTRVAVGAPGNPGNGPSSGHVRVFEINGGAWIQVGSDIDGEAAYDLSGGAVTLSEDGSRVAIGATDNGGNGVQAGHVRVYEETGGVWTQVGADIDGEAAADFSGISVSLSGDGSRVAIGAMVNDGNGAQAGHVRVYTDSVGTWVQVGLDIDGESAGDKSGISVSISADGSRVAIGAYLNDGGGANAGHVRVYGESSGSWLQVGGDIDGEASSDNSGSPVCLSADGERVAIGANQNDGNGSTSGHVRIYELDGAAWQQVGLDIDGETPGDMASDVSLSSNGDLVAVGARFNDSNGPNSGHVRVYADVAGVWTQVGIDIDGETSGDQSGIVSLTADGTRVAIGAMANGGNGVEAGHVRVFELTATTSLSYSQGFVSFSVMPVPATHVLYVEVSQRAEFRLTNAAGQLVLTQRVARGREAINVAGLPSGQYTAEMRPMDGASRSFAHVLLE